MWTDAARQAALETRRANAANKARQNSTKNRVAEIQQQQMAQKYNQPGGPRKPGPQTAAHPNAGNRVAFAARNRMLHDAGKDQRIAAHQSKVRFATMGHVAHGVGLGLLGALLGGAGALFREHLK